MSDGREAVEIKPNVRLRNGAGGGIERKNPAREGQDGKGRFERAVLFLILFLTLIRGKRNGKF